MIHGWKWGRLLRRYRDGELRPAEIGRWQEHRAECRPCRDEEAAFDALDQALRSARPETAVLAPEDAERILQAALARSGVLRRRNPWLFPVWGLATAVGCMVAFRAALPTAWQSREARVSVTATMPVPPPINRSHPNFDVDPEDVLPKAPVLPRMASGSVTRGRPKPFGASHRLRVASSGRALKGVDRLLRTTAAETAVLPTTVLLAGIHYRSAPPLANEPSTADETPPASTEPSAQSMDQVMPPAAQEPAVLFVAVTDTPQSLISVTVRETPAEHPGTARAYSTSSMADGGWLLTDVTISTENDAPTLVLRSIPPPEVR